MKLQGQQKITALVIWLFSVYALQFNHTRIHTLSIALHGGVLSQSASRS